MCLVLISFQQDADYPLILAANRDEFYARPTAALDWFSDAPEILAGRDLMAGGTWLGVNRSGHFAAVTNFREPGKDQKGKTSRGMLIQDFLRTTDIPTFIENLSATVEDYNGFNLLFGNAGALYYFSNRSGSPALALKSGVYALSNHLLDTAWPKVTKVKSLFAKLNPVEINTETIFELLEDRAPAADAEVQQTGLAPEIEKALSPLFIVAEGYGTRVSSFLQMGSSGEITFSERSYDAGKFSGDKQFQFKI